MPAPVVNLPANSNNSRIAHIRKFCALPPERGVRLVLRTVESESRTLGEWTRAQCADSAIVPADVDEALADHARATRAAVRADLEWLDDDGVRVACKTLNHAAIIEPQQGDEFDQVGAPKTDTEAANRAFARTLLTATHTAVGQLTSILATQNQQILRQQEQVHARDVEIERMRMQHAKEREKLERERLEALAVAASADGETTAHGEVLAMLRDGVSAALPALLQGPLGQVIAAVVTGQPLTVQQPAAPGPRTLPAPGGAPPPAQPDAPSVPAPPEPAPDVPSPPEGPVSAPESAP